MINEKLLNPYGYSLDKLGKSFDDNCIKIARRFIHQAACHIIRSQIDIPSTKAESSMFRVILERKPFEFTEEVIAFNQNVTQIACTQILEETTVSLLEKIAIYSVIIELGAREFINPRNIDQTFNHLGAAKENGFFFTPASVAVRMVLAASEYAENAKTMLDPACGAGIFPAYTLLLNGAVEEITCVELEPTTAYYAEKLLRYVNDVLRRKAKITIVNQSFFDYFESNDNRKTFDLIIMNPPYGSIKFLASDLSDKSTIANISPEERTKLEKRLREQTKQYSAKLRRQLKGYGIGKGVLEYSKLFMASAQALLSDSGYVVSITPSSWLGDETSTDFRCALFENKCIYELWIFPEAAKLFKGVNQPTVVSFLGRKHSERISICDNLMSVLDVRKHSSRLDVQSLLAVTGIKRKFPKCDEEQLAILRQLSHRPKIKDNHELFNARGELDLTTNKQYISETPTSHRLIRGDHIVGYFLQSPESSNKAGFVHFQEFCDSTKKGSRYQHIFSPRIAITQCSYLQKRKRIEAAIVPEDCIIGNSCNFLSVTSQEDKKIKTLYYWLVINSSIVEWQFRRFSYNNHVGNSEIDELVCIPYDFQSFWVKNEILRIANVNNPQIKDVLSFDSFYAACLGLGASAFEKILSDNDDEWKNQKLKLFTEVISKMKSDLHAPVANHSAPSLSELDKEMISYVGPGDNWTSIPETVPSKRLEQIREMAKTRGMVRTTYYSRLKHNQPAYTISTYYNRPGNGANIHPWEDRTLSAREAARIQSFPDSFVFEGNESEVRTQIGNAVPPLLGYAVGKAIMSKTGANVKFCDLFAGAGGLSYGMELAGFNGIAALELNKAAAKTFARNHNPNIHTIVGDINDIDIQNELISAIRSNIEPGEPWVMVGGPPCQGFSTAGYRDENDARNKLVFSYLNLIAQVKPSIVVMENVHGILSMQHGKVIDGIYKALHNLGYKVIPQPWVVNAEMFGVPQMRKRVLIVAALTDELLPSYPDSKFIQCRGRRETPDDRISLFGRYPITCGEAFYGLPNLYPVVEKFYPDEEIDTAYSEWCKGEISTEELFARRTKV